MTIAENGMGFVASFSGGKDSTAMVLRLIEDKRPLDKVVFFDTQMEFKSVYRVVDRIEKLCKENGMGFVRLRAEENVWLTMLCKPVKDHFGYEWCGGQCRWGTSYKTQAISKVLSEGDKEYVGIAFDEPKRLKDKIYPLVEWGMTEADCLEYCYSHGYSWDEDGVELYSILDRVSCWCCGNKNLKELRAMRKNLPYYWGMLLGLQSRIDRPFRRSGESLFELDRRFEEESKQLELEF